MKPILIAEDSEPDADILMRTLKMAGVVNPIFWVPDGDQVIAYLSGAGQYADREKFPMPGALLLDLKMPRMSGFEVLSWLKNEPQIAGVTVIVVSGTMEMREVSRAYQMGANTFVVKPVDGHELQNLIKTFPVFSIAP